MQYVLFPSLLSEEIQQHISIVKRRSVRLNPCDYLERPLAVITPEGKWEEDDDNGQGSQFIRCEMKEFERGQHSARLETEGEPDIAEYLQYLNYTAKSQHQTDLPAPATSIPVLPSTMSVCDNVMR